jgi:molybdenum cofactor cytidylyltransferase
MDAMRDADAIMFLVADQPRLRRQSVKNEIAFFYEHPDHLVAMGHGERRGNPAIFPKAYFAKLRNLHEDSGGSEVIRRHEAALLIYQLKDELELFDVDSIAELNQLKSLVNSEDT